MIPDSDTDVLRVTTHHRKYFEAFAITEESGCHGDVRSLIFQAMGATQSSGLGRFQRLPLELLCSTCLSLDIQSALRFSQVNRRARQCIASIPQCRQLAKHALECIWALYRTRLALRTAVLSLQATLTTERCVLCGLFGGFVFLPTCARYCFQWFSMYRIGSISSRRTAPSNQQSGRHVKLAGQKVQGSFYLDSREIFVEHRPIA